MRLNELAKKAFETAQEKGFWESLPGVLSILDINNRTDGLLVTEKLALIAGESVGEALEELRKDGDKPLEYLGDDGKPEGIATELADIVIRTLDLMYALDIDVELVIKQKMDYNATRPAKHGKRF